MYNLVIAEDEKILRNHYTNIINWDSIGFSLQSLCKNGREAIDFIDNNKVDCLISDIKMPFVNGIELLKFAKEKNPNMKVILISAYSDFGLAKEALKYGADDYLLKPLKPNEIKQKMINIKQELDHINKINAVFFHYQRNFLNSFINNEIQIHEDNIKSIMEDHHIKINSQTQVAIISIKTKNPFFENDISEIQKEELLIFLQNTINNVLENIKGHVLLCKKNLLKFILYSIENNENFDITIINQVNILEGILHKFRNIMVDNINMDFIGKAKDIQKIPINNTNLDAKSDTYAITSIKAAKEYIEKNIHEELSLEKISSKYFLSPNYFSSMFKKTFGIKYIDFLIKLRMDKAKELILNTDYKIYHIGKLVGYEDTKFFTKTFKKFYGISPKEYRDNHSKTY